MKSTFESCNNLEFVYFPDSLEVIEEKAFADCESLTRVAIGESLVLIAEDAFDGSDDAVLFGTNSYIEKFADDNDFYLCAIESATTGFCLFLATDDLFVYDELKKMVDNIGEALDADDEL